MGVGFATGVSMGAGFAIGISTMGATFGSTMGAVFAIGAAAIGAGFAIGAAAIGAGFAIAIGAAVIGAGFAIAIGAAAIGTGFALGAAAIGRDVGRAMLVLAGNGLGFGFDVADFGKLGIAPFASGAAAGSFAMRGISNDLVPLAVRLGSAGICFHRGAFVAAAAAGEATTAASTL